MKEMAARINKLYLRFVSVTLLKLFLFCLWITLIDYFLISEATMTQLVEYMLDNNASNSTSTLINGVTIIIDLIRHNNR